MESHLEPTEGAAKASRQAAIEEIEAQLDEKRFGPKHHAICPDCGSTLSVSNRPNGRYELIFVSRDGDLSPK